MIHNRPLLLVRDTGGVDAVGDPVLGSGRLVTQEAGGEVLRNACPFALGDEPLARGVENQPLPVDVQSLSELGKAFGDVIHRQVRNNGPAPGKTERTGSSAA